MFRRARGATLASMEHELEAGIAAPREAVWQALYGDLAASGPHVEVLEASAPETLILLVRSAPGEQMQLAYRLRADGAHTVVSATIGVSGLLYTAKKVLSFGSVDRAYLRLLAVGLDNLKGHFGGTGAAPSQ